MGINKNGGRFFNVNVYVFTPMMHFYDKKLLKIIKK